MRRSAFLATLLLPVPFAVLPLLAVINAGGSTGSSTAEVTFVEPGVFTTLDQAVAWPSEGTASALTSSGPCENPADLT